MGYPIFGVSYPFNGIVMNQCQRHPATATHTLHTYASVEQRPVIMISTCLPKHHQLLLGIPVPTSPLTKLRTSKPQPRSTHDNVPRYLGPDPVVDLRPCITLHPALLVSGGWFHHSVYFRMLLLCLLVCGLLYSACSRLSVCLFVSFHSGVDAQVSFLMCC